MAWKGLHLTQPARLVMRQAQLMVILDGDEIQIALEDIAWIIIDNLQTTISVSLLAACAEQGVAIITSDAKHQPSALTLPFHRHHKTAAIAKLQLDAGLPLKKRLWQALVRKKIENQAAVLKAMAVTSPPPLEKMAERVASGDPANIEAQAARAYWACLFENFTRSNEADWRNKALNYAYAIIRGMLARAITASGFIPAIGLHHDSATNPFNLADDLIEPFRPIADLLVAEMFANRDLQSDLLKEERQELAGLPMREILLAGEIVNLLHGTELVVQSLVRAFEQSDSNALVLPSLLSIQEIFTPAKAVEKVL